MTIYEGPDPKVPPAPPKKAKPTPAVEGED